MKYLRNAKDAVAHCVQWLGGGLVGRNERPLSTPPRQMPVVKDDEGEWLVLEGDVWFKCLDALNSISGIIRQAGAFETTELDLVRRNLPEGGTFIDIGANAGLYSLMVRHWFRDVRIHAFEPVPFAYDAFRANMAKNRINENRLLLNQMAVGDANKTVHITADFHSSNYLADPQSSEKTIPVQCVTLDRYVQEQEIDHVDFIKIDVEGKEFAVLAGAEQVLRRDRPKLLVELLEKPAPFHDRIVDDYRKSLHLMLDLGYEYFVVDDDNRVLHKARLQEGKFNGSFHNYLFYHKDGGVPSIATTAEGGR